jgi:hypothetical protein
MKRVLCCALIGLAISFNLAQGQTIQSMPPVVVKAVPEAGSMDITPGETEIRVTFSKEMADNSWSWSTAWQDSTPQFIGKPHYDADHRTCIVKVKLEPNKTYGFWLNSQRFHGFSDTDGHPAVPYLLVFHTKEQSAAVPGPEITAQVWLAKVPADFSLDARNFTIQQLSHSPDTSVASAPRITFFSGQDADVTMRTGSVGDSSIGGQPPVDLPAPGYTVLVRGSVGAGRIHFTVQAIEASAASIAGNARNAAQRSVDSVLVRGDANPGEISFYPTTSVRDGHRLLVALRFDLPRSPAR